MTKEEIKSLIQAKLFGQGNQVDLGNALPQILDILSRGSSLPFSRVSKIEPRLYEVDCNNIDYEFAKKYMKERYTPTGCKCSVFQNGNIIGRNLVLLVFDFDIHHFQ